MAFLPFYGHRPAIPGLPDAACLSQWFAAPFTHDTLRYATCEHWMMARKAILFDDLDAFEAIIRGDDDPGRVKSIGRQVRGFDEAKWVRNRYGVVVAGNLLKFSQHPHLGKWLRSTGDLHLVEAAPNDKVWGAGLGIGDERITRPGEWPGLNLLGKALVHVRQVLNDVVNAVP